MNRPPHHLTDEVLSAHADGALSDAERDAAIAHLAACSACAERADDLARSATLLRSAGPEAVDELTRRRLITKALDSAPRQSPGAVDRRLRLAGVATIAAAALTVVGMVAFIGGDDEGAETAAGSGELPIGQQNMLGGSEELDDPEALRAAIEDAALNEADFDAGSGAGSAGAEASGGAPTAAAGGGSSDAAPEADSEVVAEDSQEPAAQAPRVETVPAEPTRLQVVRPMASPAEVAAIAKCYRSPEASEFAKDNPLIAALTGTYGGKNVVVLGFRLGDTPSLLAMVLSRGDCELVNTQSFR